MDDSSSIEFNFTWSAIKLLGKSLYSNAWTAIAELVANGIDAQAKKITVLFDLRNPLSANIEICDNGIGMDAQEIKIYATIGYDRRQHDPNFGNTTVMGRKGIGKLAALYLSTDYDIRTKTNKSESVESCWNLHADEDNSDNSTPRLLSKPRSEWGEVLTPGWDEQGSGTLLQLRNVNLDNIEISSNAEKTGAKEQFNIFDQLSVRLANEFTSYRERMTSIQLAVIRTNEEATNPPLRSVNKAVAFKNFAYVIADLSDKSLPSEIRDLRKQEDQLNIEEEEEATEVCQTDLKKKGSSVSLARIGKKENEYLHIQRVISFDDTKVAVSGEYPNASTAVAPDINAKQDSVKYKLTGWIGIHSSIDKTIAEENDKNFKKGSYYNPNSLRLYVRGKLADENLLGKLGLTRTFVNYIEGEINFDLLDDDSFSDIATSSRQGFNELDERWRLLIDIAAKLVQYLIRKRQHLKDIQSGYRTSKRTTKEETAKSKVVEAIREKLRKYPQLTEVQSNDLTSFTSQQLEGDVRAKENYIIFLSHSTRDKRLADFVFFSLLNKGADKTDFFYTSAPDSSALASNDEPLKDQIRKNLTRDNAYILFITSPNFQSSQYTMLEAGAAWATKGADEYRVLTAQYEDTPEYLMKGDYTICVEDSNPISLDGKRYSSLVALLNKLVDHINKGRDIENSSIDRTSPSRKTPVQHFLNYDESPKPTTDEEYEAASYEDKKLHWDPVIKKQWEQWVENRANGDVQLPLSEYGNSLDRSRELHSNTAAEDKKIWKETN